MSNTQILQSTDGLSGLPLYTLINPLEKAKQDLDTDFISIRGMWEIRIYLSAEYPELESSVRSKSAFDDLVGNQLLVTDKNTLPDGNTGKFAARVKRWAYKKHGIKLTDDQLERLGELADVHRTVEGVSDTPVFFDLVDKIEWQAGDYGDKHSCFWGGRDSVLDLFPFYGVKAVRFYKKDGLSTDCKGFARAWVRNDFPDKGYFTIFNAYGLLLNQIASNLVSYLTRERKVKYNSWEILLANEKSSTGTVYVNNGRGVVIGPNTDVYEDSSLFDLELDSEPFQKVSCYRCGNSILKRDAFTEETWREKYLCGGCREDFTICAYSGECVSYDDALILYDGTYIKQAYKREIVACSVCNQFALRAHIKNIYVAQATFIHKSRFGTSRKIENFINPDQHEDWELDPIIDEKGNKVRATLVCPHCVAKNQLIRS